MTGHGERRQLAGRTHVFGSLCGMVFLVNIARVVYAPLLEPFRAEFAASASAVGLLATLVWIGSAAPRIPTGYLLTRVPRHHVVLATGTVLAASAAFAATATSLRTLYAGALTMGLASGAYFIAANPLVSELFPDRVGRVIGVHGTASQLAAVVAPLAVAGAYALPIWPVDAWRVVFWAIAALAVLVTVVFFVTARRATLPTAGEADRDFLLAFRRQWRIVGTGVVFLGIAGFVWNGVFNFYQTYLVETTKLGEDLAWIYLMVVFAAGVPAFWFTGRIADRVPNVPLLLTIVGAFAASLFALTLVEGLVPLFVVTVIIGYVVHSMFPTADTYLLSSLPDEHRGSAYSLYSGSMMIVQATGSVTVGTLADTALSYDDVFRGLAAVLVVLLVVMFAMHRLDRLPAGASG